MAPEDYEEGKQNIKQTLKSFNDTVNAFNRLQQYRQNVTEKTAELNKRVSNRIAELLMTIDIDQNCMNSLMRIINGMRNGDLWALKFLDSQPSMSMSVVDMSGPPYGNYDECLSIESAAETDKPTIKGQYCALDMDWILDIDPADVDPVGLLKAVNSSEKTKKIFFNLLGYYGNIVLKRQNRHEIDLTFEYLEYFARGVKFINGFCLPTTCKPNDLAFAINQCKASIILSSMVIVTLLSTIIDLMPKTMFINRWIANTTIGYIVNCFSGRQSAKQLFSLRQYEKLKAMDGMKAGLTFWVILVHTYESGVLVVHVRNYFLSVVYRMKDDYRNMLIPNPLLMDNFMFISAILLCNTIMSKLEQSKGRFNYIQFIIFRYLRVVPILIIGICISFLFEYIGDGPFWGNMKIFVTEPCYKIWYASADFQLYALSPIAFLALYKMPKIGVIWNFVLLIIGISIPLFMRYGMADMPHIYESFTWDNVIGNINGWQWQYWSFFPYVQTYVMGMLLAYTIRRHPNAYLGGRIGEAFLWLITLSISFWIVFWNKDFLQFDYKYDGFYGYEMHAYLVLHKVCYLTGFSWLIYACATGRADTSICDFISNRYITGTGHL
ncbi:uncharacterized protein LOC128964372 [Oppia nitens]|uniref:uncharacterized protein LOC128964372 n=1 Tax=Oppia nitens TaxID=1686743 RepID=UPI0023DC341F|nr:uncharacterized protein LOC128964372 [Oppia nitens]